MAQCPAVKPLRGGGCKCNEIPDVFLDVSDDIPAPQTPAIGAGGPRTLRFGGARVIKGGAAGGSISLGVIVVIAILFIVLICHCLRKKSRPCKKDKFYTEYAQEEPTRSYTPYTGAVPYGYWGTTPWAYAFDLAPPSDIYNYLPDGYRDPTNVL